MNGENNQRHSVLIRDRKFLELTGISEVENFNETAIDLISNCGAVAIEGENLRIESFSVESGKIVIEGTVTGVFYYEKQVKSSSGRGGFFQKRTKK